MKDELDALHRAVTAATSEALDTFAVLDVQRTLEQQATAQRLAAERAHAEAVSRLAEARAALDAKLGLRIVAAPLPGPTLLPPRIVISAEQLDAIGDPLPIDDDEPVR